MPPSAAVGKSTRPPKWIKPQLTRLVDEAPSGHLAARDQMRWLPHARAHRGPRHQAADPDRSRSVAPLSAHDRGAWLLKVKSAYLDGELCELDGSGVPVFSRVQAAGSTDQLVFFAFDLLYLNGESTAQLPLIKRKERLQRLFKKESHGLRYSERVVSDETSRTGRCRSVHQ